MATDLFIPTIFPVLNFPFEFLKVAFLLREKEIELHM